MSVTEESIINKMRITLCYMGFIKDTWMMKHVVIP